MRNRLHVALWQTIPPSHRYWSRRHKRYRWRRPKRKRHWYLAFNCKKMEDGKRVRVQIDLSDWLFYPKAYSLALKCGKKLNLPVIKNGDTLLWEPSQKSTPEQKKMVKDLRAGKECKL